MKKRITRHLVINALNMAVKRRKPTEELIFHNNYQSRSQARQAIFEYIEVFYNKKRLHSTLDYKSPDEYEKKRKTSKICV